MKLKHVVLIFSIITLLWSCAAQTTVAPGSAGTGKGAALFARAEESLAAGSYDEALALYLQYTQSSKNELLAAAALMKIGFIHESKGEYEQARAAYQRIPAEYPASSFVQDALVAELSTYYYQGRYPDVIRLAPAVMQRLTSNLYILKVYAVAGDAHLATDSVIDAIDSYVRAREHATEAELPAILDKLKEAIARLDTADLAILVNFPDDSLPMGFLMYQLGLNYALEEKYDDALNILAEFTQRHPDNKNRILVESLIEEIKKNAVFEHQTIGVLLPLSGPYERFGFRALKGIELALAQYSSLGDNPPINISVKDTGADPDKTIMALEELHQEQVAAILGPIVTSEIAGREAQRMGIPIITLTQKDDIPKIGDKVFRNFITPKMQVEAIASFTVESLGLYRFAILYPDENYGRTFMNLFWDEIIELGGEVVGVETYNPKQTDFTDPIKKLVGLYYEIPEDLIVEDIMTEDEFPLLSPEEDDEALVEEALDSDPEEADEEQEEEEPAAIVDFDGIFIPDSPGLAGLIVPQLAYYDIKDVYLLGTNLWHSDTLIKMADQYVQGAVMPDGFFAESTRPVVQNFVAEFRETYQEKPDFIEAVVFDSAMILFHAVSRPYIRYRNEIRDELLNLANFPGITGITRFDETGEVQKRLHLLRIKGKRFVELE
ncbi:Branched-chain amino acid ABC transporter, amino acid-binding protein (TC 3.A.1.4.1) [Olavius algarvensis Delta 1 endosymbiont]|nr:Branched-chain amino acid ABC transporter, amino acid-binding protein (TC 3.A.1.4.1) [Olavius algarvensis Delta 1 endosymbiont]